jgi:hypothetical protein
MTREQIDAIAWQSIHSRPVRSLADDRGWRPRDYQEIERRIKAGAEFERVWGDFLHAFYDHRDASFFAHPSPPSLSPEWQALLAGAADWLSEEFGLPHPVWTDNPRYFLVTPWDPLEDMGLDMAEFMDDKLQRSPEAFRKRNIAYLSRNLIAL